MRESLGYQGKVFLVLGLIGIIHSLYSSIQHLTYLKATSKVEASLPTDIILESLIGLLLCMISLCYLSLPLKPIILSYYAPQIKIEQVDNAPSFMTFHRRGKKSILTTNMK
ncbi:hypothetical protein K502DRAFT_346562 [Neoconidiobolus thromboides FSU 785]|nr:hypothetical protein K502DRAFT_346562 [Neoconidiobolus thromboides FSU 785]